MNGMKSLDVSPQNGRNRKKSKKQHIRTLGPVSDLEMYVNPEWWRQIFNSFYLKTDGDVVDDINITRQEINQFSEILRLSQDDRILDLCCGQGRHTLEMTRRGFKYVEGLDRSHYLIQRARSNAKKEGLDVKFKEGDARKLPYPADTFDVVMIMGNSFGYFETVNDDLRVLSEVFRVLKPWGRLLIDVADGEHIKTHFKPHSWEWIDKTYFVCRERSLSHDRMRLISRELINNINKGVIADQFYAERLYTHESITGLLKETKFNDIQFHGVVSPDSQRNQDLGMMEQRLIVTGIVRKEWTAVRRKPKEAVKNVAVVFGDPNKPDMLKPSSVFDDDDFYTVDQSKNALHELPGYKWIFLNNHDTLFYDLAKLVGKIDYIFNLCDEGFGNDPRKELHIPSILEMLGIPYSGSGPQCLAFCYDKSLVRGIAKEMDIPVPEAFFIKPEDMTFELPINFPAIIKPNFGDSSFGITQKSVANTLDELLIGISEIREKFGYDKPVLVEEFLIGKDLSVGIIGNSPNDYRVLPIVQEDYSILPEELPKISGYEAKWLPDSPYWNLQSIPADLPDDTEKMLIEYCVKLSERLECRDYTRFDWRLDANGIPRLLEVNPNPGWCWDGHLMKMAKIAGMSYPELLQEILHAAEKRLGLPVNDIVNEKVIDDAGSVFNARKIPEKAYTG